MNSRRVFYSSPTALAALSALFMGGIKAKIEARVPRKPQKDFFEEDFQAKPKTNRTNFWAHTGPRVKPRLRGQEKRLAAIKSMLEKNCIVKITGNFEFSVGSLQRVTLQELRKCGYTGKVYNPWGDDYENFSVAF